MQPEHDLVRYWLYHVEVDLRCAEVDLAAAPPLTLDACFHCQQAVEKALKAFLVYRDVEFETSHLIAYLLDLCAGQEPLFEELRASAVPLTVYASRLRYPLFDLRVSLERAGQDLDVARRVRQFVLDRLPEDVHPNESLYA